MAQSRVPDPLISAAERRRSPRLHLQIPMFLRGKDIQGHEFLDLAKTLDISAGGAYLAIAKAVRHSEMVSLTIPAPPPTHTGLVPASSPPILARVTRIKKAGDVNLIGLEFTRPLD